jgi:hypothetical protein
LNATWYEDERLTGSDWTAGVHLELPFEAGDLGDGKGFWDRIGDAFKPRRRHLAERMVEPVKRQNAAVKVASSVEEDKSAAEVEVVTRVVSQSRRRIVLADSVVFVDNAIGSPANPGTYEQPVSGVQTGVNLGNVLFGDRAIVFVQGRPQPYAETITINQPTRLFGSGSFPALGGKFFFGRTRMIPIIDGKLFATNIAGRVEIAGFEIIHSSSLDAAIVVRNVSYLFVHGNFIHDIPVAGAMDIRASDGFSSFVHIADNVVTNTAGGIYVGSEGTSTGPPTRMTALIEGNKVFGNMTGGIAVTAINVAAGPIPGSIADYTISGNVVFGNGTPAIPGGGIVFSTFGSVAMTGRASGNLVFMNVGPQIMAQTASDSSLTLSSDATLSNTVFSGSGGIKFDSTNSGGGPLPQGSIFINGIIHPANVDFP